MGSVGVEAILEQWEVRSWKSRQHICWDATVSVLGEGNLEGLDGVEAFGDKILEELLVCGRVILIHCLCLRREIA